MFHHKIYSNITELVGRTPLVRLNHITAGLKAEVVAKLETFNPAFSVKDRVALGLVERAMVRGKIKPGDTLIEPSSGNTGIGLALVAVVHNFKLIIVMPESASEERRAILKGFGAQLVLTPKELGMSGSVAKAKELLETTKDAFILDQFNNPDCVKVHEQTTAEEIWTDTEGKIDAFVTGIGSGATLTGVGRILRQRLIDIKIVGVEPKESPVLAGGKPSPHGIQGIGAGFIPSILDQKIYDALYHPTAEEAMVMSRRLMKEEGIMAGISSGASACAALFLAQQPEFAGKRIVFIICDSAERYLSTKLFQDLS